MAIKHATKSPKGKQQNLGFSIVFFALNFLLVPFSAYATYAGYKEFLEEPMAILLAAVTGLLFFGLNYFISEKRKKGEPHLREAFGFLLPLMISFFGNFAYFYGGQMEGTLLEEDLTKYRTTLTKTYNDAIGGLTMKQQNQIDSIEAKNDLENLRTMVESELSALESQINDGGCFGLCDQKWEDIKQLFTDYNIRKTGSAGIPLDDAFTKEYSIFEEKALGRLEELEEGEEREIEKIKQIIQRHKDHIDNTTDFVPQIALAVDLLKSSNRDRLLNEGEMLIKDIKRTNDDIGLYTSPILNDFSYTELMPYEGINRRNFKGVLKNAFIDIVNPAATFISTILSLVIDLATLGFVVLILVNVRRRSSNKRIIRGPQRVD
ncbi:MAG TPA: hypothetical protein DCE41_37760 [Cytophagales bacterium]|nr:hypothetical protein [Cytophagales bacterium]HAA22367.1 hypothetical protein [Cytophagales bacterium]HAP62190.1 hypothetical protein [Cytophagales bacterium]